MNKLKYILGVTLIFFIFIQTGIGYELQTKLKKQIDILVDKKVTEKNAPKILQKIDSIDKINFSEPKKEAYNYIYKKVEEKLPKTKSSNTSTSSGIILEQNSSSGSKNNKNDTINQNATEINYNDKKYQTQIENSYGKGLNFVDSTKIYEEGKVLFNGHRYFLQSDEYYEEMNKNKTPIKVAGSFGNDKNVYNTEEKGFVFTFNEGSSTKFSGDKQRLIDLVRYNDNFYFQDIIGMSGGIGNDSVENINSSFGAAFGGVYSFKEMQTIGNHLLNKNGISYNSLAFKQYLIALQQVVSVNNGITILTTLNLKTN